MIINPQGATVKEWTDWVADEIGEVGAIPTLESDDQWKKWAEAVALVLPSQLVPNPYGYDDWMAWAEDFNKAVRY